MNLRKHFLAAAVAAMTMTACSDSDVKSAYDNAPEPPAPGNSTVDKVIKPKAMWIDCHANFRRLATKAGIDGELSKIKRYGFNMIYLDIKPSNGYALYKSDILPYCNTFADISVERDYDDYLGYILDKCEELGIDVVGSVGAMGFGQKGNNFKQGYVYDNWDKWGDKVQVRSDNSNPAVTIPITEDPLQTCAMLDPMFPEVQDLLVNICREIVTKYPKLKGISLDYLRYNNNDGGYFGMGDANMKGFGEYWGEPAPVRTDIVTASGGMGPQFAKWIEFRSMKVTETLAKVRQAVKAVNPDCEIHLWASSHWESRYAVGQNFASKRYKATGMQYTSTYSKTGFADLLDVFITGAYANIVWDKDAAGTVWSVENFVTNYDNYLMGDCKCYGSIQVYDNATTAKDVTDATWLCLQYTDGYMNFELSHTNNRNYWIAAYEGIHRYEGSSSAQKP